MSVNRPEKTDANGRLPDGRFGAGNQFAAGNENRSHAAKLHQTLTSAWTEDNIRAIVAMLLETALVGDTAATKLLLDRALGKVQSLDSGVDEQVFIESSNQYPLVLQECNAMPPDRPALASENARLLMELSSLKMAMAF